MWFSLFSFTWVEGVESDLDPLASVSLQIRRKSAQLDMYGNRSRKKTLSPGFAARSQSMSESSKPIQSFRPVAKGGHAGSPNRMSSNSHLTSFLDDEFLSASGTERSELPESLASVKESENPQMMAAKEIIRREQRSTCSSKGGTGRIEWTAWKRFSSVC